MGKKLGPAYRELLGKGRTKNWFVILPILLSVWYVFFDTLLRYSLPSVQSKSRVQLSEDEVVAYFFSFDGK